MDWWIDALESQSILRRAANIKKVSPGMSSCPTRNGKVHDQSARPIERS